MTSHPLQRPIASSLVADASTHGVATRSRTEQLRTWKAAKVEERSKVVDEISIWKFKSILNWFHSTNAYQHLPTSRNSWTCWSTQWNFDSSTCSSSTCSSSVASSRSYHCAYWLTTWFSGGTPWSLSTRVSPYARRTVLEEPCGDLWW